MIHCHMDQPALERPAPEGDTEGNVLKREGAYFRFDDYRTANSRSLRMVEAARRISLTDYRVLISGEPGTEERCWPRPSTIIPGEVQSPL